MTDSLLMAVKIGNTNIGIGVFAGSRLDISWRIETRAEKTADEYASDVAELFDAAGKPMNDLQNVAICSVVPELTLTFQEFCQRYLGCSPFVVAPGVHSGIKLRYDDARALGADRLAALVGAKSRYGCPALVIGIGTATTFNALSAEGEFVGGAIAPGPRIQAEALHQFTAKLPRVEITPPPHAMASNTRDALRSGLFYGYVGLLEGMVSRLIDEMGPPHPRVIATGGLAPLVVPYCPSIEAVDAELELEGVRILYELNEGTPEHL